MIVIYRLQEKDSAQFGRQAPLIQRLISMDLEKKFAVGSGAQRPQNRFIFNLF